MTIFDEIYPTGQCMMKKKISDRKRHLKRQVRHKSIHKIPIHTEFSQIYSGMLKLEGLVVLMRIKVYIK